MMQPMVSIIIPALNEERTLDMVLEELEKLTYPNKEIIVMDNNSTDATPEIAKKHNVRYINNEGRGLAKNLNKGMQLAKGEFVMINHADCVPEKPDTIERMLVHFKDDKVAAVVIPIVNSIKTVQFWEKLFTIGRKLEWETGHKEPVEVEYFNDKCDIYRKSTIEKFGGFVEDYRVGGEDLDLSFRLREAGYKIMLEPSTFVNHLQSSHQRGIDKQFKKTIQYGEATGVLYRRFSNYINPYTTHLRIFSYLSLLAILISALLTPGFVLPAALATILASAVLLRVKIKTALIFSSVLLVASLYNVILAPATFLALFVAVFLYRIAVAEPKYLSLFPMLIVLKLVIDLVDATAYSIGYFRNRQAS